MIKILAVDDEKPILDLLKISLKNVDYICDTADNADAAIEKIQANNYDLILLDIMLPGTNGFELLEYIKSFDIPVIFLTAKSAVSDRVKGLRMGAEDYIVKPFEIAELLARIEVVLRRYNKTATIYDINGLHVDTSSILVTKNGEPVKLTPKEFELLVLFLRTPNTALYRDFIYEKVWGGELEYGSKTVDLHVQRLRNKTGLQKELQTVNKIGYRLIID